MGYVTARKQVDAQALLDSIQTYKHRHQISEPVLLVVHQDLFRNGNSFVFGLARESVGAGVVSTSRLGNEYYGRRAATRIILTGLQKRGHMRSGISSGFPTAATGNALCSDPIRWTSWTGEKSALPVLQGAAGFAAGRVKFTVPVFSLSR